MRKLLIVGCGLLFLVLAAGALPFIDTFGDMRARLEALSLPKEWRLVAVQQGGLRSGLAAAGKPYERNLYDAPWESGALCERLLELAQAQGNASTAEESDCNHYVTISAGLKARAVGVWHYRLWLRAEPPARVQAGAISSACERDLKYAQRYPGSLRNRHAPCLVTPGNALVIVTVQGL